MPYLSVVVPVYRSAPVLKELHRRLSAVLTDAKVTFEIIFVEDCGGDGSWDVVQALAQADDRVHGLRMSRNFGQQNALLAGVRAARGEVIATLDDDLQHPPEELPKLLAVFGQGHDVVYGWPERQQHGLLRNAASHVTKLVLQEAMGLENAVRISAFRVFSTRLREAFAEFRGPPVNLDILLTWGTRNVTGIPVRHDPRCHGRSGYDAAKLLSIAINLLTGFSAIPLRLASAMGVLFAAFGILLIAFVLLRLLITGYSVPGFPFLAASICLFSGVQLLTLGVLGEYVARIYLRSMNQPAYLVRETTPSKDRT
ncbi:MAG: glycosyltransferase family 2 protein [Azospirillaceae bacterium]|nr:glycosyltransferase family 2 protein [Azospirillaceae bacterium]